MKQPETESSQRRQRKLSRARLFVRLNLSALFLIATAGFALPVCRGALTGNGLQAFSFPAPVKVSSDGQFRMVVMGPTIFLDAMTGFKVELWEADAAGCSLQLTSSTGAGGTYPQFLTAVGARVFFSGFVPGLHFQLWVTDGTVPGTHPVTSYPTGIYPSNIIAGRGGVFFDGIDSSSVHQLFWSDGVSTVQLTKLAPVGPAALTSLVVAGDRLFFAADDGTHGSQLWTSDGTVAGTQMVTSGSSSNGLIPQFLTVAGSNVYFSGFSPTYKGQLYRSDGTTKGTIRLTLSNLKGAGSNPQFQAAISDLVLFGGSDAATGTQLWRTDGTSAGTSRITSYRASGGGLGPILLTTLDKTVYFSGNDGVNGSQLWMSDGTSLGTHMVKQLNGTSGASAGNLTPVGSLLYFTAINGGAGYQLWLTNGTSAGTKVVTNFPDGNSTVPAALTAFGDALLFAQPGTKLWTYRP